MHIYIYIHIYIYLHINAVSRFFSINAIAFESVVYMSIYVSKAILNLIRVASCPVSQFTASWSK